MTLLSLPPESRPRERLVEHGAAALSTVELLAILLNSGMKHRSVLQLATDLLSHFGTLEALADANLSELSQIKGIGQAKAIQLQASFSLCKRIKSQPDKTTIDTPEAAFRLLHPILKEEKTEVLYILLRDARRNLLHKEEIGRGILNQVIVHPREIFCSAIRHRAHSLIVAHNHPSGDPTPSTSDIEMTHRLILASKVIGIALSDHLIIGKNTFFSFHQKRMLESDTAY